MTLEPVSENIELIWTQIEIWKKIITRPKLLLMRTPNPFGMAKKIESNYSWITL
jgi:hypothetical protein